MHGLIELCSCCCWANALHAATAAPGLHKACQKPRCAVCLTATASCRPPEAPASACCYASPMCTPHPSPVTPHHQCMHNPHHMLTGLYTGAAAVHSVETRCHLLLSSDGGQHQHTRAETAFIRIHTCAYTLQHARAVCSSASRHRHTCATTWAGHAGCMGQAGAHRSPSPGRAPQPHSP